MLKFRPCNNLRKTELYSRFVVRTGSYSVSAEEMQSLHVQLYISVNSELVSSSHHMLFVSFISFSFSPSLFLSGFPLPFLSIQCI